MSALLLSVQFYTFCSCFEAEWVLTVKLPAVIQYVMISAAFCEMVLLSTPAPVKEKKNPPVP